MYLFRGQKFETRKDAKLNMDSRYVAGRQSCIGTVTPEKEKSKNQEREADQNEGYKHVFFLHGVCLLDR